MSTTARPRSPPRSPKCSPAGVPHPTSRPAGSTGRRRRPRGRRTGIRTGYRPQFYLRTTDVAGLLDIGETAAQPGDTVQARIELDKPVALAEGSTFAIREGGRTVGAGTVAAILD